MIVELYFLWKFLFSTSVGKYKMTVAMNCHCMTPHCVHGLRTNKTPEPIIARYTLVKHRINPKSGYQTNGTKYIYQQGLHLQNKTK